MRLDDSEVAACEAFAQRAAFGVIAFAATNQLDSRAVERLGDGCQIERYRFTHGDAAGPHLLRECNDFFAYFAGRHYAHEVAIDAFQFVGELRDELGAASGRRYWEYR